MEVEVWCFLSTKDAVVLKRKYAERLIRLYERLCDSLGRDHHGRAFLRRKIEQRRDMPTRDNATLADFELPRIYHGERMFALVYDRPPFFATCHSFTKVARILYGKFDQLPSPIELEDRRTYAYRSSKRPAPRTPAQPLGGAHSSLKTRLNSTFKLISSYRPNLSAVDLPSAANSFRQPELFSLFDRELVKTLQKALGKFGALRDGKFESFFLYAT
jgi:hypothetical protein